MRGWVQGAFPSGFSWPRFSPELLVYGLAIQFDAIGSESQISRKSRRSETPGGIAIILFHAGYWAGSHLRQLAAVPHHGHLYLPRMSPDSVQRSMPLSRSDSYSVIRTHRKADRTWVTDRSLKPKRRPRTGGQCRYHGPIPIRRPDR
jgi:hypothetical protein